MAINLGRTQALADSYAATLQHYAYLQPDYVCIYDDLGVGGGVAPQDDSGVFALTGYAPILPLVLREKGMALRFGAVASGYSVDSLNGPAPSLARRAAGRVLQAAGTTASALDRRLGQGLVSQPGSGSVSKPDGVAYAEQILALVDDAHSSSKGGAKGVILVVGPAELATQRGNLAALADRVPSRLASRPWLRFVNLADVPELSDRSLRLDGWSYGGEATWAVARRITPAILDLMHRS